MSALERKEPLSETPIESRQVLLAASELIYENDQAITDLTVAATGAMCCLRRKPHHAEVLVWDGEPTSSPASWTEGLDLDLLHVVSFDGARLLANTGSELVLITPGSVRVLIRAKNPIVSASLSPNQRQVVWIEKGRKWVSFTASVDPPSPTAMIRLEGSCYSAAWIDDNQVLVRETREREESEEEVVFLVHMLDEAAARPLFSTRRAVLFVATHPGSGRVFVGAGGPLRGGGSRGEGGPATRGTWMVERGFEEHEKVTYIAKEAPGSSAYVTTSGFLFSGMDANPVASTLFCAAEDRCTVARTPHFVRDFVMGASGLAILFREFGNRGGIRRLRIDPLLAF